MNRSPGRSNMILEPKRLDSRLSEFGVISYNAPSGADVWFSAIFSPGREGAKIDVTDERPNLGVTLEFTTEFPPCTKFLTDDTTVGPQTTLRPFSIRGTVGDKKLISIGGGTPLENYGMYYALFAEDDTFPPQHSTGQSDPVPSVYLVIQPVFPKV